MIASSAITALRPKNMNFSNFTFKKLLKSSAEYMLVIILVAVCLMAGRFLHQYISLLPGSLYGMLLFALVLSLGNSTGLMPEKLFHSPMTVILRNMSFVFIPVSVGVMQYGDLLMQSGIAILFVGFTSAFVLLAVVGLLTKKLLLTQSLAKGRQND